jgi:hypothetical protein
MVRWTSWPPVHFAGVTEFFTNVVERLLYLGNLIQTWLVVDERMSHECQVPPRPLSGRFGGAKRTLVGIGPEWLGRK